MTAPLKFNFGGLPTEMQFEVLDHLSSNDRLKLMSVNSKLRQMIFEDGPFGRIVEKVRIADPCGGRCCAGPVDPLWLDGHGLNIIQMAEIPDRLYREFRSIGRLKADGLFECFHLKHQNAREPVKKAVAHVEHVERLFSWLSEFSSFAYLFEVLIPGVQVTRQAFIEFSSFYSLDGQRLKQIFDRNFINCQEISIRHVSIAVFDALSMTNAKRIEFWAAFADDDAKIKAIFDWLLTRGIPSRNKKAECRFVWDDSGSQFHPLLDLVNGKGDFDKITDELIEPPSEDTLEPMPQSSRFPLLRKVLHKLSGGRWFGKEKSPWFPFSKRMLCYRRHFNEETDLLIFLDSEIKIVNRYCYSYSHTLDCKYGHREGLV